MYASSLPNGEVIADWTEVSSTINLLHDQIHRLVQRKATGEMPTDHLQLVRQIRKLRIARAKLIGHPELFGEAAWDMLLELYALALEQRKTSVSGICLAAGVPATTALRWLEKLHGSGFVVRQSDDLDARGIWVRLSDYGLGRMNDYFGAMVAKQS